MVINASSEFNGDSNNFDGLMNIRQASCFLNISTSMLYKMVFRHQITFVKIGKLVRFRKDDLLEYIERNLRTPEMMRKKFFRVLGRI